MKRILVILRNLLRERFNLDDDKADEREIVSSIKKNIEFRGHNLWTLIFAIFIASIGLNVNSTAVVIGAMLISPLMGPIMGIGLGIGINDLETVRSGGKNLGIAAFFSILTSTFYFWITPLHEAQSEILARTTPSLWDVFIAFFGGLAGIVAGTRKEKTNVIPGVAIATALMPPLCTAGFGLANGKLYFFLGALYLFFINCVFICISTFLIVRFLDFHKKEFETVQTEKRVSRTIWWVVVITTLPSIYLAYRIVQRSIFESNAKKFIAGEFHYPRTQVVNESFTIDGNSKRIDLLLIGEELTQTQLDSIRAHLTAYGLDNKTQIVVKQGLNAQKEIDFSAIRASILQEVFQNDSIAREHDNNSEEMALRRELLSLYPGLNYYSITPGVVYPGSDTLRPDTMMLALMQFREQPDPETLRRLSNWLKVRLHTDSVNMILQ